ncbi:hypothetical protein SAMN05421874_12883 [Nonomuraea maritima]|uniref:Uncharacterized protein n=1 Tax=Nonomuraea maritima TaxID=683260 RepID=A0A1G9MML9_9ACTN|nr:hypothetical protein [Nonomuraea maritima]SDL74895.1 hypothetical protein SAMN05421874_12883 [Nonomuraea maritima]
MTITPPAPALRVTGKRLDELVDGVINNRLTDVGVAARDRLVQLLDGDGQAADRMINQRVKDVENDPVFRVECDRLPNAILLAALNAAHLANQLAAYLCLYHGLACEVTIDLEQGDGQVIPIEGATSPVFIKVAAPVYNARWQTAEGPREMLRITAERFNARLGIGLARRASLPPGHLSRVWDITVSDATGRDVTSDFPVIHPRRSAGVIPFAEAYVPLDATPARVAAHMERLVERYPDVWKGGLTEDGLGIFHWMNSGFLVEVQTVPEAPAAYTTLPVAIHRINCAALGVPMSSPMDLVERLVRVAEATSVRDRNTIYQLAIGEVTE